MIPKLISLVSEFSNYKELVLNISRILSKLSIDFQCAAQMTKKPHLLTLLNLMESYGDKPNVLIRIAFVLGNLTTHYEDVRYDLSQELGALDKTLKVAMKYLDRDEKNVEASSTPSANSKQKDDVGGSIEDSLTKLIRLLANLCTDEETSPRNLLQL